MSRHVTPHPTLSWIADSASRIFRNSILTSRPVSRSAAWLALIAIMSAVTSETTTTQNNEKNINLLFFGRNEIRTILQQRLAV